MSEKQQQDKNKTKQKKNDNYMTKLLLKSFFLFRWLHDQTFLGKKSSAGQMTKLFPVKSVIFSFQIQFFLSTLFITRDIQVNPFFFWTLRLSANSVPLSENSAKKKSTAADSGNSVLANQIAGFADNAHVSKNEKKSEKTPICLYLACINS